MIEQAMRLILDNMHCGVAIFGPDGRIRYYNDRFGNLLKISRENLARLNLLSRTKSEVRLFLRNIFSLVKTRRDEGSLTVRVPDQRAPFRLKVMNIIDNGTIVGVLMFEDVDTPRKALQSTMADALIKPALIHDMEGKIIQLNSICLRILGYSTLGSLTIFDIEPRLTEEQFKKRIERLTPEKQFTFKTILVSWDGTEVPVRVKATTVETAMGLFVINIIDFDETLAAKIKSIPLDSISNLFDAIPIPALLWKIQENNVTLELYNEAAVDFTDGRVRTLVGTPVEEIFVDMPEIKNAIIEVYHSGYIIRGEVPCYSRVLNINGIFLLSFSRPNPNSVIMTITDITRHVNLQKRLHKQAKELTSFAHDMSHDVKALLHSTSLHLELLEDEQDLSRIEEIRKIIEHIDTLLTESVHLAEAGEAVGRLTCCDLNRLLEDVISMTCHDSVEVVADSLPQIRCDDGKVHQIFLNIIRNAIEHGKATRIRIKCEMDDEFISILISNNGHPIPEDVRDLLLKKRVTTKPHGGRGMLIVRKLVESHGWHIDLVEPEHVTFRIRIPKHFHCVPSES